MSIQVGFYETRGLNAAKSDLMLRTKMRKLRTTRELAQTIENACTLTQADIVAVLNALSTVLGNELLAGNRVQLDGIGTFSLSVKGEIKRDKNGKPLLHDASVRDVLFTPSMELKGRMKDAKFTTHNVAAARSRADISDTDIQKTLTELCQNESFFTLGSFAKHLGLTYSTARRRLIELVNKSIIENIGSRAKGLYRLR
ncbi:MAG: HU family DNA-binding protein [Bacteroidaceae bacterium]|nr:HU family DNA-binding protein [Bacteroidaceae bacterium]